MGENNCPHKPPCVPEYCWANEKPTDARKLAEEWHKSWLDSDDCYLLCDELTSKKCGDEYVAAFLAGYAAAIEAAAKVAEEHPPYTNEGRATGITYSCSCADEIPAAIRRLDGREG